MYRFLFLLFLLPTTLLAQSFPVPERTTINDYANLLSEGEETVVHDMLAKLRRDTDVEMTVLTLTRQADYAPDIEMEVFATDLFNNWGIGDRTRNDGVLILILQEDRAMRIELGAAYGRDWDRAAANVIDDHFLDAFAEGNYARGIQSGTQAAIDQIVTPFRSGEDAPKDTGDFWIFGAVFAFFGLALGQKKIADMSMRLRRCPNCGQRGLRRKSNILTAATRNIQGMGKRRTHCIHCDYEREERYVIPIRRSSSGGSGFGGGSSGGGGASGRW